MSKEWKDAQTEYAREQKMDPYVPISCLNVRTLDAARLTFFIHVQLHRSQPRRWQGQDLQQVDTVERALVESGRGVATASNNPLLAYICRVRGRTEQQTPCLRFTSAPAPQLPSLPSGVNSCRVLAA